MAKSLATLKKKRKSTLETLREKMSKDSQQGQSQDERFWKPIANKNGYFFGTVRLLPTPPDGKYGEECFPYAKVVRYYFKNPKNNKFLYVVSPKSVNAKAECPIANFKNHCYNLGFEDFGQKIQRKETYIVNVYVVDDKTNPENNGKVYLWEMSKSLFKKVTDAINPPPEKGVDPIDVFDFWEGCDFELEGKPKSFSQGGKKLDYLDLSDSRFAKPSELFDGDDDKKEEIWKQSHPLNEFSNENPDFIHSVEEIKKKLESVIGLTYDELMSDDFNPSKFGGKSAVEQLVEKSDASKIESMLEDEEETEKVSKSKKSSKEEDSEDDLLDELDDLDLDDFDDLD